MSNLVNYFLGLHSAISILYGKIELEKGTHSNREEREKKKYNENKGNRGKANWIT